MPDDRAMWDQPPTTDPIADVVEGLRANREAVARGDFDRPFIPTLPQWLTEYVRVDPATGQMTVIKPLPERAPLTGDELR